jgi:D-threo-aldose 1-dehydrogenase
MSAVRRVTLTGTQIETTAMGFGCASLFHEPSQVERSKILREALDSGIRHLDVAPIYGMGQAEVEIGRVIKQQRDSITITTKYGIDLTRSGRMFGRVQRPIRSVMRQLPSIGTGVKESAQSPTAGRMGELLYKSSDFSRRSATQSLERSLRLLDTDYVDVLALHAPSAAALASAGDLLDYLDEQVDCGRIRCWGIASDVVEESVTARAALSRAQLIQSRLQSLERFRNHRDSLAKACIAFGIFDGILSTIRRRLDESPDKRKFWSERLEVDFSDESTVPNLLLRNALFRNISGPVLYSSTSITRVRSAASQGALKIDPDKATAEAFALADLSSLSYFSDPHLGSP